MTSTGQQVIDFRVRPPTPEFSSYPLGLEQVKHLTSRLGTEIPESYLAQSVDQWRDELNRAGVTKAVVLGRCSPLQVLPNDYLAETRDRFAPLVVSFGAVDPMSVVHDPVAEIERCIRELSLSGVYVEPGLSLQREASKRAGIHLDDPRMVPIYETCRDLGVPVIVLTGPLAGGDLSYTDPARIDRIASMFPTLSIICGHGCWPYVSEIMGVAYKRPNVFISPDMYLFMPGGGVYVEAMRHPTLSRQILFATCYPLRGFGVTVDAYHGFGLPHRQLSYVLYENAAQLLKMA